MAYWDEERKRWLNYDTSLQGVQNDFSGTMSGLVHQYDGRQLGTETDWASGLANIQSNYLSNLGRFTDRSNSYIGDMTNRVKASMTPGMVTVDYGYKGQNPATSYQGWQQQVDQLTQLYNRGTGLLSKYQPDAIGGYNQAFQSLLGGFRNASQSMYNYDSANFNRYHHPATVREGQEGAAWNNYVGFRQNLEGQRTGVLSQLSNLANLAQDVYSRGLAAEGQMKQRRLTERNQWFANEAQRNANMVGMRAEQRQGRAMGRQRQAIASASNPYGLLSSQNLTR